jgi:acetylornithine deacetylase/succinyl-diaminopimelate desuccinylase-like protein
MRVQVVAIALLIGCHGGSEHPGVSIDAGGDAAADADAATTTTDHLKEIFDEVDGDRITQLMRELSGEVPVMVNGAPITLGQRYDDAGRKKFRDYWIQTMQNLGLEINPLPYQAEGHPRPGDDVEAILRGPSADSIIIIVHYDSIGPPGSETSNPGADDDMSGMSILLETARLFVKHRSQLALTVRFVASDEEEVGGLAGARYYGGYIKDRSQREGFALVAAVDDEQSGWNCSTDGLCGDALFPAVDVFSCGHSATASYDFPALGDQLAGIVARYSTLHVKRGCLGANSDHFAMWEIGVPAVVYSEHNPFANPHFDQNGGDVFAKIDLAYLISIARPAITFQAALAGVH